jgi:hypothetical protein
MTGRIRLARQMRFPGAHVGSALAEISPTKAFHGRLFTADINGLENHHQYAKNNPQMAPSGGKNPLVKFGFYLDGRKNKPTLFAGPAGVNL